MDSSEPSAMGIAKLKARLEALERSQAQEIADLREAIERLQPQAARGSKPRSMPPPLPESFSCPSPAPVVEPAPAAAVPEPVVATPASVAADSKSEVSIAPVEVDPTPAPEPLVQPAPLAAKGSMELQIGRVWLVRVGVVLLLTGLVLLGSYAYQNWIREMPAAVRLAALFLASIGMGLGGWRLSKMEKTERFGEVLLAGGMAFFYWCTFAAHQVDRLRVIESPVLAAFSLLAVAAGIVGVSIRRKDSLTAMMGLLMASYATTLQPVGWLAAGSNVVLAAAGIFLMRRPGWGRVGFASMLGIYGSYLWWNLLGAGGSNSESAGLWFVGASWAMFALPGVVGLAGRFEAALSRRATAWFVGLNNAACFGLISLQWWMMDLEAYWRVPAVFGVVLLVLGGVSRGRNAGSSTQLSQGLAMLTVALLLKLQGYQLAVGLGIEAVALAGAFWRFRRLPELSFAILAMVGATVVVFAETSTTTLSAGFVALCLALASGLIRWGRWMNKDSRWVDQLALGGSVAGLTTFGLVTFFGWIIKLDPVWQAGLSAVLGLGFTAGYLRGGARHWFPQFREASVAFAAGGVGLMLWHGSGLSSIPASVVALTAACAAYLWERHSDDSEPHPLTWIHAMVFPLALGVSIHAWELGDEVSLLLLSGAVPGLVLAFRWLGSRSLVLGSGVLLLLTFWLTAVELGDEPAWAFLTMVSALASLALAAFRVESGGLDRGILMAISRTVATASWLWAWFGLLPSGWVEVIPLTTMAMWLVVRHLKLEWRLPELLVLVAISLLGFVGALADADWHKQVVPEFSHGGGFVLALAGLVFVPGLLPKRYRRWIQGALFVAASLWLTQLQSVVLGWQPMVILWSALGFGWVAIGLWKRMATLRHGGFLLLALSFAKLFLIDVWVFETFTRVLAFIALGVALVVLGFFYNRFAPVLKRLLESEDDSNHPITPDHSSP